MKKILLLISFVGLSLNAQTNVTSKNISKVNYQVDEENVIKTLSYLTSDELEGRDSGSEGIEKAAVFLEGLMKENGLKSYFKTYRDTLSNFDKPAYNVVGYLEGNDPKLKNEAYLRRFGRFINSLGGRYITAEDVNMKTSDMEYIAMETKYVTGLPEVRGGGGDPSPVTAYGTYLGMKAAAKKAYGSDNLEGKKIAVQGIGQVGKYLVEYLVKEKAQVFITDIFEDRLKQVSKETGATVVDPSVIYDIDMDIYAPCALGATVNDQTIDRLKCQVIAGAANNQLQDEAVHGKMLLEK